MYFGKDFASRCLDAPIDLETIYIPLKHGETRAVAVNFHPVLFKELTVRCYEWIRACIYVASFLYCLFIRVLMFLGAFIFPVLAKAIFFIQRFSRRRFSALLN